jgi:hypothetical protein
MISGHASMIGLPRRKGRRAPLMFLLIALFVVGFACAKNPTPEAALQSYIAAVQKKDAKSAYKLLSKELQQQFGSEEKFVVFFKQNYPEILQEAERLASPKIKPQREALLPLENNSQIFLKETPQGWQVIETDPLERATTVQDALKGLIQLARKEASNGPIGFYLSAEAKKERAIRLNAFALMLARVGPYDISVNDDHATVRLQDSRTLRFFREDGHWCLVSLPEELLF